MTSHTKKIEILNVHMDVSQHSTIRLFRIETFDKQKFSWITQSINRKQSTSLIWVDI